MIGCTKLLCGTATVSEAIKMRNIDGKVPANMLQFSGTNRPLVVWNVTNRCNLRCKHCYISAEDRKYQDELTTAEAEEFIRNLADLQIPVLLFSGGEPLIREDIFHLSKLATELGVRVVLSTNGTLITPEMAESIKESGMQYVGISLDGLHDIHDEFRCMPGAMARSIEGIKNCMKLDINSGVRFTVNKYNREDLAGIIDLLVQEGIPRFCMYHLVYSGRGKKIVNMDTTLEEKRETIEFLIDKTIELYDKGVKAEILTVDNHADGVYIYNYLMKKNPERAEEVMQLLKMHGGCSAGTKFANVDPQGNVHPCQFWQHVNLGNVRERKFGDIWNDKDNEFLESLRNKEKMLKGRCGQCTYKEVCGGCRIRAEVVHGDIWAEDPACYLSETEIGIA
ncbi:MAG: Fe-coproporphyrin synthase [Candidatus Poribacteria bacterium]|nr:Fe-coproporphyrin synthase [Candidatus Poribacteria bacterium]